MSLEITLNVHIPALDRIADALIAEASTNRKTVAETDTGAMPEAKTVRSPRSPKAEEPKVAEVEPESGSPSSDALRAEATKLLQQINKANGIEAVRAAIGEFGVQNISALTDDKLAEAVASFKAKIT